MNLDSLIIGFTTWAIPILLAVTLHEAAHGWAAWRLGDPTAKMLGRVTFNPLRHIDPFGTILLPAGLLLLSGGKFMFGFAKPVPVDFRRLRPPRLGMVLVAFAGPATNLLMALAAALGMHAVPLLDGAARDWVFSNLLNMVWINALLFVFNMLPLPPLDGGRVAVGLLPRGPAMRLARLEQHGIFIILGVLFILPFLGDLIGLDLEVFPWLIGYPAEKISQAVFAVTGVM